MGKIFLVGANDSLIQMGESAYPTEDHLQDLLARYPDLLPGDEMDPAVPRRWLLIEREAGVPEEEGGGARWFLDHLFVDQDGVPTLVEVKRSTDGRLRREVVGQMLDYAANGVAYWPVEHVQSLLAQRCSDAGMDPDLILSEFLGEQSPEDFWRSVKTNLQAGRVRMLFVADAIPPELERIVEFLNGQMDPAEVLAVEIPRYTGGGLETLVPRVVGQTAESRTRKSGSPSGTTWTKPRLLDALEENAGATARNVASDLIDWSATQGMRATYGRGAKEGSFFPILDHSGNWYAPFALWTYGQVELQFQYLKSRPAYQSVEDRELLRAALNEIAGVEIPEDGIERRPSFPISVLDDESVRSQFKQVVLGMLRHIREGVSQG